MPFDIDGIILTSPSGTTLDVNIGATNAMKVNANGVLTRPQTPHYRGQLTGLGAPYFPGDNVALKGTAIVNIGSCWNNATGLFTCPVAGKYLIQIGHIGYNPHGYYAIYKNGTNQGLNGHWNFGSGNQGNGSWRYTSQATILPANAGDYFSFGLYSVAAGGGFYAAGGHGMQSITLMA
jgi:hypothetical protein